MVLKILKADYGDSILIKYYGNDNQYHNILIDGGLKRTYQRVLKKEIDSIIKKKEFIDLLIVTHIDQDHINGILGLITDKKDYNDYINKYWFNQWFVKILREKSDFWLA